MTGALPGGVHTRGSVGQVGGDPTLVRWVGLGVVLLLVVFVLYLVVRYGEADRGGDDDSGELFTPGPAYGATGTMDVEEVLRIDEDDGGAGHDGTARGDGNVEGDWNDGRERVPSGDPSDRSAAREDEDRSGTRFTHDVRERRDGEWLVEVTDGDRSARFTVARRGSVLLVDPVASPAQRHGSTWVLAAERYLRDREFAIEPERE